MTDKIKQKISDLCEDCGGKTVKETIKIKACGTFGASSKADKKVKELGYSKGSMQRDAPIGICKTYEVVGKWRNLARDERPLLEGALISEDFREGDVYIVIFE